MPLNSPLETSYFINSHNNEDSGSAAGYWEPHTSSIDFCESNYFLSDKMVEPHNVWSSIFGLSLFGIVGIIYGNPTNEWSISLFYFILLIIGIGSACLHATLHWTFQSFDELPMIYLVMCALYLILEVDSQPGESKYPNLAKYLLLLSCLSTAIYYKFQHLYIVFLATFDILTIIILYFHVQIAWKLHKYNKNTKCNDKDGMKTSVKTTNNTIALQFYKWHLLVYLLVASPIWALDQFFCESLLPVYNNLPMPLNGMTLHVVWHICAGLGAHFFMQFLCACRASNIGMLCGTRYVLGALPVVTIVPKPTASGEGGTKQD